MPKGPTVKQLRALAKKRGCRGYSRLSKADLVRFVKTCSRKDAATLKELRENAKSLGCRGYSKLRKAELVRFIERCRVEGVSNLF